MKKILYVSLLLAFPLLYQNCCAPRSLCQTNIMDGIKGIGPNIELSGRQIIFRFNEEIALDNESEKSRIQDIILKYLDLTENDIDTIELCPCGDQNRQIWTFKNDILDIETKLTALKDNSGGAEVEGDRQFTMVLPKESGGIPVKPKEAGLIAEYVQERPGRVNIAILDTGIDLDHIDAGKLFMNPPGISCGEGKSGWNFIDNSTDIQDDHTDVGHGTLVTNIITAGLNAKQIDYRILPLKVFDSNGKGTYWDIVCAMSFVQEIQERTGGAIKLVNASFGGSMGILEEEHVSILKDYIDNINSQALVVASAGNCHFNTDRQFLRHYPSGYSSDNIIAVGGFKMENQRYVIHDTSNYGKHNIDVAASFNQGVELDVANSGTLQQIKLSGTSYSAAFVTSVLAEMIAMPGSNLNNPSAIKTEFLTNKAAVNLTEMEDYIAKGRYVE